MNLGSALLWGSGTFAGYTYLGYPVLLKLLSLRRRGEPFPTAVPSEWPVVSITVPAYNEEHQIGEAIESLLALDYPPDRRHILVVSDASTDRTDEIVRSYADRGVELVRQPVRSGKTAAEGAVAPLLYGDIIVNTDASIRIEPHALKQIVAPFQDPAIGLASGRDVSVGVERDDANRAEAGYVGYEMWLRDLETRVDSIVGASGSFYAIRRALHHLQLPASLSRDFAAALNARERGYRGVSVASATAVVPRTRSLKREYRRKVRTITRGIETLVYKRALLDPTRYRLFSWMLLSHKVFRWLTPWAALAGLAGLALLAPTELWARALLALTLGGTFVAGVTWLVSGERPLPKLLAAPAYGLMGIIAALAACVLAVIGDQNAIWEPTRRQA